MQRPKEDLQKGFGSVNQTGYSRLGKKIHQIIDPTVGVDQPDHPQPKRKSKTYKKKKTRKYRPSPSADPDTYVKRTGRQIVTRGGGIKKKRGQSKKLKQRVAQLFQY